MHLVHVSARPSDPAPGTVVEQLLEELAEADVPADFVRRLGDPLAVLSELTARHDCTLLVLGTSHHPLGHLSGTAGRLLHDTRTPMLFVPPVHRPSKDYLTVMYGTDFSHAALAGAAWVRRLESIADRIHLVTVVVDRQADGGWVDEGGPPQGRYSAEVDAAMSELERLHVGTLGPVERHVTAHPHVVSALLLEADRLAADLLIVSTVGHSALGAVVWGSVSTGLLRDTDVPLLVIHPST